MKAVDSHRIAPKLHIGGHPPARLREYGFDLVVLCALEDMRRRDIQTIYVGLIDVEDPMEPAALDRALQAARQINDARRLGKRVLVTCQAGVNRSALVAAMALIQSGWTVSGAIERIRDRREPPIGMMPLENERFVKILQTLGRRGVRSQFGGWA